MQDTLLPIFETTESASKAGTGGPLISEVRRILATRQGSSGETKDRSSFL
jgi:hypothetical protein